MTTSFMRVANERFPRYLKELKFVTNSSFLFSVTSLSHGLPDGTGALAFVAGVLALVGMGILVFYTVS